MKYFFNTLVLGLLISSLSTAETGSPETGAAPKQSHELPVYGYRIVHEYPHDRNAFTQGLIYEDGKLYEGTGQYGESSIRQVDLETGSVLSQKKIASNYFGEGITLFQGRLIQLTWLNKTGFVYDPVTFEQIQRFSYPWQGWGITHNDTHLIMSDGTDTLRFLDPDTYESTREIHVTANGSPVQLLNELEYINREIYANVWMSDLIMRIDPESGNVQSIIDLKGIFIPEDGFPRPDVLNGIAYDQQQDRLFVTGKYWHQLFHIELVMKSVSLINDWQKRD